MNARAYLLDLEAQVADHNRAIRDEHHAAAPEPDPGVYYIGNDALAVPDARDLAEMERWER